MTATDTDPAYMADQAAEHEWPAGKTFGELTPAQKANAARRAGKQLEAELKVAGPAIEAIMAEPAGRPRCPECDTISGHSAFCPQHPEDTSDRPRARYIHADDGLANEYATSAIQVAAGLLASQYHQAKVWAEGDESSVWAYLPDTWVSSAAGVLAAVCRG